MRREISSGGADCKREFVASCGCTASRLTEWKRAEALEKTIHGSEKLRRLMVGTKKIVSQFAHLWRVAERGTRSQREGSEPMDDLLLLLGKLVKTTIGSTGFVVVDSATSWAD